MNRIKIERWLDKQCENNLVIIASGILNRTREQIEKEVGCMTRNQWEALVFDLLIKESKNG